MPDIFISDSPNKEPSVKTETVVAKKINDGKSLSLITAFCKNPLNVSFIDQEPDEKILLFLRRHFITNLSWIIKGILLALVPFLAWIIFTLANTQIIFMPVRYINFILIFYYFIVIEFFFLNYLNWFFNISLVTTIRVYDVDFSVLVFKDVAGTKISQIEDVSNLQVGPIRSIFDFGDVEVQTAGSEEKFDFTAVPHPEQVIHIIDDLIGGEGHA